MSYTPATDFLALLRTMPDGTARLSSMPGLDWVLATLSRAGLVSLWVDPANAPTASQATTVWLKVSASSWATEGTVFLWDAASLSYQPATAGLWSRLLQAALAVSSEVGPASSMALVAGQSGLLFTNSAAPLIEYTLPAAASCPGVSFEFMVTTLGSLNILVPGSGGPNAGTVQFGGRSSTVGIASVYVGSYLKVRVINGQWFVIGAEGSWTLS